MARLLVISYEFPPKGGTQSQHVAKLVAGLARAGHTVTVLTVADVPTTLVDERLLSELPDSVHVERTYSREPTRAVQALKRVRARLSAPTLEGLSEPVRQPASRGVSGLPPSAIRFVQAFFLPDEKIGWKPFALRAARRLHAEAPFDAILSSGPPFSAHAIAREFAASERLPWVVDLRDPVVGGYFFRPHTPAHGSWWRRFERDLLASADAVLVATQGMHDSIAERHADLVAKVTTIPNGFDAVDFADCSPSRGDTFRIAYVGVFQHTINPRVFLAGLRGAMDRDAEFAADVCVRFVGPVDGQTEALVRDAGFDRLVERTGFVSHDDAVAAMCAATVLLLVLGPEPASRDILTSKLPEYLAAGRPVLALVPDGVAADVVRRAGAGEIVPPDDAEAVADALVRLHAAWREGSLPTPDRDVVAEFDRAKLVERVGEILESAIREGFNR